MEYFREKKSGKRDWRGAGLGMRQEVKEKRVWEKGSWSKSCGGQSGLKTYKNKIFNT